MIIFRIFFNLFRIVTRGFFNIFWLPFSIIGHHPLLFIGAIALFCFWLFSASDDQRHKADKRANPPTMARMPNGKPVQVATPVQRVEDGDSAFANDLYQQMTPEEKAYYSQAYHQAMNQTADGAAHRWSQVDIAGVIVPDHSFINKTGERCRMFAETLKVHAVQQQITGMGCEEAPGQWCKLRANATPACNLSHKPGALESMQRSFDKLF